MSPQRLCVSLDPAVLLEGLVLRRLAALPAGRRQAWLRSLLVGGLLWEGRAVQALAPTQAVRAAPPASPFAEWLAHPAVRPVPETSAVPQGPAPTAAPAAPRDLSAVTSAKPFAHLRAVIG